MSMMWKNKENNKIHTVSVLQRFNFFFRRILVLDLMLHVINEHRVSDVIFQQHLPHSIDCWFFQKYIHFRAVGTP